MHYIIGFVKDKFIKTLKMESKKILLYAGSLDYIILTFFYAMLYSRQDYFNNTVINIK